MEILANNNEEVKNLLKDHDFEHDKIEDNDLVLNLDNFNVYYNHHIDGGGIYLRDNFLYFILNTYEKNKFNSCLEWCAGPGFIGFTLLDKQIVNSLDLIDISENAINACNKTIQRMPTGYNVNTILSDTIATLTSSYDLIVGNPPWYPTDLLKNNGLKRIYCDANFSIHHSFFKNADKILNKNGKIILVEGLYASHPKNFNLNNTNLEIEKIIRFDNQGWWHDCYMMVIKRISDD